MNVHIDWRDTVLYALTDGEIDLDTCIRMFVQITDLAKEKRTSKILVDGSLLSGDLSDSKRIELAVKVTDHLRHLGTHPAVAVVGKLPSVNGLGVLAMQSTGADFQLFAEIPEGIDWLNKSPHLW